MPRRGLYELVYLQKREAVFRASFIEVSEVNAKPALVILLYEDWIGEPVWVEHLSNEAAWSSRSASF